MAKVIRGTFNVLNSAYAGGADPTGVADSKAAFQAALNAISANHGGTLYIPAGDYKLTSGLTYTSSYSLRIQGDGPQATRIHGVSTSGVYLDITGPNNEVVTTGNDGAHIIDGISYYNDTDATSPSTTNIFIRMTHVMYGQISNVGVYTGLATGRINQAIVLTNCKYVDTVNNMLFVLVNGVACTATGTDKNEVCRIRQTTIWQTDNGGNVATAAGILCYGRVLTLHISEVVCHHGPRALYCKSDGTYAPHLIFAYDFEPNNHSVAYVELADGLRVDMVNCFFSGGSYNGTIPGLLVDSTFEGALYLTGCNIVSVPGHSIDIEGGKGYNITGCQFGGSGIYKNAANTYDEIHIAGMTDHITIDACHFNTDGNSEYGTNKPRSALNVGSSVTNVSMINCKGPGSSTGYGTSAVIDASSTALLRGNIGLNFVDTASPVGNTITTGAKWLGEFAYVTIPANDAKAGDVYRITAWGYGTQATGTPVNLSFRTNFGGSLGGLLAQGNPAAGTNFAWKHEANIKILTAGAGGTMYNDEMWYWGPESSSTTFTIHGVTASRAINTTQANNLVLELYWASATGSPKITCAGVTIEKLQNVPILRLRIYLMSVTVFARCVHATIKIASCRRVIRTVRNWISLLPAPAHIPLGGSAKHADYVAVASSLSPSL